MTSRDFCYWLQGFFEVTQAGLNYGTAALHADQIKTIQNHLAMVFIHEIDPSFPAKQQEILSNLHSGGTVPVTNVMMRC